MSDPLTHLAPPDSNYSPDSTRSDTTVTAPFDYNDKWTVYPLEMCMITKKPKYPCFLYKFTDEMGTLRCYLFRIGGNPVYPVKGLFTVTCSGCQLAYVHTKKHVGEGIPPRTRKTDGLQLMSNAMVDHIPGCLPKTYEDVRMKYSPVTQIVKDKFIKGEDIIVHVTPPASPFSVSDIIVHVTPPASPFSTLRSHVSALRKYPVLMAMKNTKRGHPMFVYRLEEESSQCYRFNCFNAHKERADGLFLVFCSSCLAIYRSEKRKGKGGTSSRKLRKVDGYHMMSDPCVDHLPGCVPLDYQRVTEDTPLVSEAEREQIIKTRASCGLRHEAGSSTVEGHHATKVQGCLPYDCPEKSNIKTDAAMERLIRREDVPAEIAGYPVTSSPACDFGYLNDSTDPQYFDLPFSMEENEVAELNIVQAQPPRDILKAAIDAAFLDDDQWFSSSSNKKAIQNDDSYVFTELYSISGEPNSKRGTFYLL